MKNPRSARGRPRSFDRDQALDHAMRLFWTRGYEGTSVAELAAAMGVNPPSLYAAFGDKRQLFNEAVEHYQAIEGAFIARALEEAPTAREAIRRILSEAAGIYARPDFPRGCMVVAAATNCAAGSADVAAGLAARRAAGRHAIRGRLQAARDAGELPPGADPVALADLFVAVLHGLTVAARDGADAATLRRVADGAMAAWPA